MTNKPLDKVVNKQSAISASNYLVGDAVVKFFLILDSQMKLYKLTPDC